MVLLVVMLAVALLPSAQYVGDDQRPYDAINLATDTEYAASRDYALCFFPQRHMIEERQKYIDDKYFAMRAKTQRVTFSALVLVLGMLNRLWRLHKAPMNIFLRIRETISSSSRDGLQWLLGRTKPDTLGGFMFRRLIFCPILAFFLTLRILADLVASKAFEASPRDPDMRRHANEVRYGGLSLVSSGEPCVCMLSSCGM